MPSCQNCFMKSESVRELGDPREKAPLLVRVGSSAEGEVYLCPNCGEITVRFKNKKRSPDKSSPPSSEEGLTG